jgi:glycosyltransferase involved in cell wall biosynthesis
MPDPRQPITLHVILRTCDRTNVHNDWRVRYCDLEKSEIIRGCVTSLIRSITNVTWFKVKLTILDDHSSENTVSFLKSAGAALENFEIIQLEEQGYQNSGHQQFLHAKNTDADLVYCIEDDYLHQPSSITEMVDSYYLFVSKLKNPNIVLYPFDAPECYDPPTDPVWVVHGTQRHWRTGIYSTFVLFTIPDLIRQHWNLFETLALNYNGMYLRKGKEHEFRYTEDNTIWNIWKHGEAIRFNPIPSLALHLQFDRQLEPFIDWKEWWAKYAV